jgi:hypothetical protein
MAIARPAVPVLPRLDEVLETTAAARVLAVPMLVMDAEREIPPGLASRRRPADALALWNGIPAPIADGPGRFGIDIERDYRDAVDALEFEEGRMKSYWKVPGLL